LKSIGLKVNKSIETKLKDKFMEKKIKIENGCEHKILIKTGEGEVEIDEKISEKWSDYQCVCCQRNFRISELSK